MEVTPKIKYRLEILEKGFAFQILEMDERFRGTGFSDQFKYVCPDTNYTIQSVYYSNLDIKNNIISLRGSEQNCDLNVMTSTFSNNEERDDAIIKLKKALYNWSKKWSGFTGKPEDKFDNSTISFY